MKARAAFVLAGTLLSGPAFAQQAGSIVLRTGGGCYQTVRSFAAKYKFPILVGNDLSLPPPKPLEDDVEFVSCTIAPCSILILVASTEKRSVEAEIQKYLASDRYPRDRARAANNLGDCVAKRTIFEKPDR